MVEIVRKRTQAQAFTQVLVAVVSGAAAMYCLQNFKLEPVAPVPAPVPAAAPAPSAPTPSAPPPLPKSILPAPEPSVRPATPKGESAMMIVPEPGGAPQGMLHAANDDPLTGPVAAAKYGAVRLQARPATERPRLKGGGSKPTFGAAGVAADGIGQKFIPLGRRPGEKALQTGMAAEPSAGGPPKKVVFAPQPIAKDDRPDLTPAGSLIDPSAPPAKPFWTEDRVLRVGMSATIALVGLFYMIFQSGLLGGASEERGDRPS